MGVNGGYRSLLLRISSLVYENCLISHIHKRFKLLAMPLTVYRVPGTVYSTATYTCFELPALILQH